MKINEFKAQQVNEELSSWIGELPAAFFKGMVNRGTSTKDQMVLDVFIKDFVSDALVSLDTAIKSGWVDPSSNSSAPTPSSSPASNMTRGKSDPNSTSHQSKVNAMTKGPVGKDAAGRVPADDLQEARFQALNAIFESIVEAEEDQKESISEFLRSWFTKYMNGVNWERGKNRIFNMIDDVQKTYSVDKGRAALKKLAQAAYALSKVSHVPPAGMSNQIKPTAKPTAAPTPSGSPSPQAPTAPQAPAAPAKSEPTLASIKADMQTLANQDPSAYADLIKTVLKSISGAKTAG